MVLGSREHWLVDANEVEFLPRLKLGSGGFGSVVGAKIRGVLVVAKLSQQRGFDKRFLDSAMNELRLHRRVRHPNIAYFMGATLDPRDGDMAMFYEYVEGYQLQDFVKSRRIENNML